MLWLSRLEADAGYWGGLMVPLSITSAGLGLALVPMTLTVLHGVDEREAGVASAVMSSAQQLGAVLCLAVLTTVATSAAADRSPGSLTHGGASAHLVAAALLAVAAAVTSVTVNAGPPHREQTSAARSGHLG